MRSGWTNFNFLTCDGGMMGLDMYAFAVKTPKRGRTDVDLSSESDTMNRYDLRQWRKFNALHGWMERLYREKGGKAQSFNCVNVRLTKTDLMRLWREAPYLEATPGFFFGEQRQMDAADVAEVRSFCTDAIDAIRQGYKVFYDSWW